MRGAAVLLPTPSQQAGEAFTSLMAELSGRFGDVVQSYESEQAALADLADGKSGLVHLAVFESEETALPDVGAWLEAMAPGAVMVVTTTASDVSSNFAKAKGHVMDNLPAVSISLGLTTEAVVAQRPTEDGTPIVEMLRRAPFAVGAFLAVFGEQIELHGLLHNEPEPSPTVRALIGRVIDQQVAERDAFLAALRVYKEESARLSAEVVESRARSWPTIYDSPARSGNTWSGSSSTESTTCPRRSRHRPPVTRPSSPKRTCSSRTGSARPRPTQGALRMRRA